MRLECKGPNSASYVVPIRHYTPKQGKMIQAEIEKLHKAGVILPSTSQYASCCHRVREKDGTVGIVQDFQGLNAFLKTQSGGLGDLLTIDDEMDRSAYFSLLGYHLGILRTNDPRGRQVPYRISQCVRKPMGVRTLWL